MLKNFIHNICTELISQSKYILILGHMRAGSSLLEHILSSNSEILGAGEQSRIYSNKKDFKKMNLFNRRLNYSPLKPYTYMLDQVLHNDLTPNINLIKNENIKVIFLIRDPHETLASIENFGKIYGLYETGNYNSITYYNNRLQFLLKIKDSIAEENNTLITYNDLVKTTERTLDQLTQFLQLKTPLTPSYRLKKTTGHLGDRSKNIYNGKVTLTEKSKIRIEDSKLNLSYEHFNNAKKILN